MKTKLLLFSTLVLIPLIYFAQCPANSDNWEIIKADYFETDPLNETLWHRKSGPKYNSPTYYDSSLPYIETSGPYAGRLVLPIENNSSSTTYPYKGSRISTLTNYKYGYFEASVIIPTDQYLAPSVWLSKKNPVESEASTWPPEIDIFEYHARDSYGDNVMFGSNFRIGCSENGSSDRFEGYTIPQNDPSLQQKQCIVGVEWNENYLKWYINHELVGTTTVEVPHDFMRIVLSLSVMGTPPDTYSFDNTEDKLYVGWVRVWKPIGSYTQQDYEKWPRFWHNDNTDNLGQWQLSDDDRHITGDFDGDNFDEVLSISLNNTKLPKQHSFNPVIPNGGNWTCDWTSTSLSQISNWNILPGTKFISGKFNENYLDRDLILCISPNNTYAKLINFNGTQWDYSTPGNSSLPVGNNTLHTIGEWQLNTGDKFYKINFDGDPQDELLCISTNGDCYVLKNIGSTWNWITLFSTDQSGQNTGQIAPTYPGTTWNMSQSDIYTIGDFNGNGTDEILLINDYSECIKLFEGYNGNSWKQLWVNYCDDQFSASWDLNQGSKYYAHNMNSDLNSELFCISPDGKFEKILYFNGATWKTGWGNDGSFQIYNRDLVTTDRFFFGNFKNSTNANAEALWFKNEWVICNTTHVYLHETPTITKVLKVPKKSTELEDLKNNKSSVFKVYPNPSDGKFEIKGKYSDMPIEINVFNSIGENILHKTCILQDQNIFDISSQPSGIYYIVIQSEGEPQVEKIIIL